MFTAAVVLFTAAALAAPPPPPPKKNQTGPERFWAVKSFQGTARCELALDFDGSTGMSVTEDKAPVMLKAKVKRTLDLSVRFDEQDPGQEKSKIWLATLLSYQGSAVETGEQTLKGQLLMKGSLNANRALKPDRGPGEDGNLLVDLETGTFTVQLSGVEVEGTATNQFAGEKAPQTGPTTTTLEFRDVREQKLPAQGLRLSAMQKTKEPVFSVHNPGQPGEWVCQVDLSPAGSSDLKAVIDPLKPVERGQRLALHGGNSTPKGKIDKYEWTFEDLDCKPNKLPNRGKKTSSKASVDVLCPMTVRLTVWQGPLSDTTTQRVDPTPRKFSIKANYLKDEVQTAFPSDGDIDLKRDAQGFYLKYQGGENTCALEDYKDAAHRLHPARDAKGSWADAGYETDTMSDPDGPFDGVSFVKTSKLEISRRIHINPYIHESGPNKLRAQPNFYAKNLKEGRDVAGYLAAVRAHEGMGANGVKGHSGLFEEAMKTSTLAEDLESCVVEKQKDLVAAADALVKAEEIRICNHIRDPLKKTWPANKGTELLFPWTGDDKWHSFPTTVGGEQIEPPPCQ